MFPSCANEGVSVIAKILRGDCNSFNSMPGMCYKTIQLCYKRHNFFINVMLNVNDCNASILLMSIICFALAHFYLSIHTQN